MAGRPSPSPSSPPAPLSSSNPSPPPTPSSSSTVGGGSHSHGINTAHTHGHHHADRHRTAVHPSILQPRVAVVLNVPPLWHPWLFALRLLSCAPAAWWGLPSLLHLLLRFLPGPEYNGFAAPSASSLREADMSSPPYALTETALATIWVCIAVSIGCQRARANRYNSVLLADIYLFSLQTASCQDG